MNNYNNNDKKITNTTYSPISLANGDGEISKSRLTVSYFNQLLKLTIGLRVNGDSNDSFAKFNTENPAVVYVSWSNAKILYNLIEEMEHDDSINNVCIELKGGLLKVSKGNEFGSSTPCISITSADKNGNITETIYQTKAGYYKGAKNYNADTSEYESVFYDGMELEQFKNVLFQYYNASTYAIAASVMEAGMYKRNSLNERINAIGKKVGAFDGTSSYKGSGNYNSQTFLSDNNGYSSSNNDDLADYESSTFEDIASRM